MTYLRSGLGAVLLFAVVVRVSAEVVAPALPLLVVVFALVAVANLLFGRHRRW